MTKIIVIGGGVIGCSVARELSAFDAQITVLERGNDVAVGTSKANSGIVHAGFDAHRGSAKARFNVAGAKLFPSSAKSWISRTKTTAQWFLIFLRTATPSLRSF